MSQNQRLFDDFSGKNHKSHTWNMEGRDGVVLLGLAGLVLRHVSVLDLDLPVNHLCLHSIGGLDQLLALSEERN